MQLQRCSPATKKFYGIIPRPGSQGAIAKEEDSYCGFSPVRESLQRCSTRCHGAVVIPLPGKGSDHQDSTSPLLSKRQRNESTYDDKRQHQIHPQLLQDKSSGTLHTISAHSVSLSTRRSLHIFEEVRMPDHDLLPLSSTQKGCQKEVDTRRFEAIWMPNFY